MIWLLWFILIGVNYGFSSWLPSLLVLEKGITLTNSFLIALITSLAQIPGYYVASVLIDRMERKWLLAVYALGATIGAIVVAFADTTPVLVLGSALLAAFTNGAAGVYYTYTAELYPTAVRATAMGTASAVGRLGAITAPIAIGYLFARIGWLNVFLVLVGALVLAVAWWWPSAHAPRATASTRASPPTTDTRPAAAEDHILAAASTIESFQGDAMRTRVVNAHTLEPRRESVRRMCGSTSPTGGSPPAVRGNPRHRPVTFESSMRAGAPSCPAWSTPTCISW